MQLKERNIKGVFEVLPRIVEDHRGFFMKSYDTQIMEDLGLHREWKQENHSATLLKNTFRGFHFQLPPYSEAKLIRCIKGSILNVFVDLRIDSETFGSFDMVELSESNRKMLFLPRMCANGFYFLEDGTELVYKSDNIYMKEFERAISWDDPDLKIPWPVKKPILSQKDENASSLASVIDEIRSLL